ncbi:MAG: hypothetical protein EZS28_046733, partial [Streblomastix strix]
SSGSSVPRLSVSESERSIKDNQFPEPKTADRLFPLLSVVYQLAKNGTGVDGAKLDSDIESAVGRLFVQWQQKTGAALSFPHTLQQSDIFQQFGIPRVQSPTGQSTPSGGIGSSRHRYMSPQSTPPTANHMRTPSQPMSPNASSNAQYLLSDRDNKDKDKGKAGDKGKKSEDVLEQLQDENSDLKVKVAFFEKEIKRKDDENAQYRKEIITVQEECRWREQEKLDTQKKVLKY